MSQVNSAMHVRTPEETYQAALEQAKAALSRLQPMQAAAQAGVTYTGGEGRTGSFQARFFGTLYHIAWPAGTVRRDQDGASPDVATRLVLLHYLATADGTPMADQWIAFRNLPGGLGYDSAFQKRANLPLAQAFGADRAGFEFAARKLSGERLQFGDSAFSFRLLPRVWLGVVLYLADDEFPASANVLFDGAAAHYLPTEDLAVVGGMLAGRLIKAARARENT